ncbi:hypothetical protein [Trichormus variabilis]|uniref:Uncharacterized protein n=1 Tax=Trichormus variabilis NIES-23 TaxID=1973479 RepID=A0A1Z4KX65_ANAVA|nr:hypothetical protein [Trichormus variabilis]MBD2352839.1 hypothetical protein [Trichormus variabilis FACHB-171]BAY73584.1 hypothetical protein NIES23_64360 [Trichormus variabilis NIES-23]
MKVTHYRFTEEMVSTQELTIHPESETINRELQLSDWTRLQGLIMAGKKPEFIRKAKDCELDNLQAIGEPMDEIDRVFFVKVDLFDGYRRLQYLDRLKLPV